MYYNENTIVYLNGEWLKATEAKTDLYAQTLHYGNGVFEGIRSYDTKDGVQIFKAKEHFERLLNSAEKMHLSLDYSAEELEKTAYQLLQKNHLKNAYIRPLIYSGANMGLTPSNDVNVFFCAWKWGRYLGDSLLRIMTSSYERPNPKSCHVEAKVVGHYTNSILATTEAKQKGYDEALLLDANGNVAEGPGANFFLEKDGQLYTPSLGNILPGITRATVFDLAKVLKVEVNEELFTPELIKEADSAFFTGTAAEIVGIASLDDFEFPMKWEDSIGYVISKMYKNMVIRKDYQRFELV